MTAATSANAAGPWSPEQVRTILESTLVSEFIYDAASLSTAERETIAHLAVAGRQLEEVFEDQLHRQALAIRATLLGHHEELGQSGVTENLLELFDLEQGPIATTFENVRVPFLDSEAERPGKNVYPPDASREAIQAYLAAHPDEVAEILDPRTVVRRTTTEALRRDLATLRRLPVLPPLHPALGHRLEGFLRGAKRPTFYAVPYSVAWADQLVTASGHLLSAAQAMQTEDRDLAAFLRLRARDLLTNKYEPGDAAWIRGHSGRLTAIIGPYESYDDTLFGTKTFFGMRILLRDVGRSAALESTVANLQRIEDALPIDLRRVGLPPVPIGVYDVVASFGEQRHDEGSLATILPNDADVVRKYGRRILIMRNVIADPGRSERRRARWRSVTAPEHGSDLTIDGYANKLVWHEVGHYVGPEKQPDGRSVPDVLGATTNIIEELKAELVASFSAHILQRAGYFDESQARELRAAALSSAPQEVRPNRSQAYETGWHMQTNWLLERGVLLPTPHGLLIRYELLRDAVEAMLHEVLELQARGTKADADAFVDRYTAWDDSHDAIAERIRRIGLHRFVRERPWQGNTPARLQRIDPSG